MIRFPLFIIALIVLLLHSCQNPKKPTEVDYINNTIEKEIIITGEILDFDPDTDDFFIKFGNSNILGAQETYEININDNGEFSYTFTNTYPGVYYLFYKHLITFYAFPNDSIHISINKNFYQEPTRLASGYKWVTYSGSFHQMTLDYHQFIQYFYDSVINWPNELAAINDKTGIEYKEYINQRTIKRQQAAEYFEKTRTVSPFFSKWVKLNIQYRALDDLMRYRWANPYHNKMKIDELDLPESYFDFLNNQNCNNKEGVISWYFGKFQQGVSKYYSWSTFHKDSMFAYTQLMKDKNIVATTNMKIRSIIRNCNDYGRDLALGYLYYWLLEIKDLDTYEQLISKAQIKDQVVLQILDKEYNRLSKIRSNPKFINAIHLQSVENKWVGNLLDSIANKYKGKVLYIDFWAPWCSPCMGGIEHATKFKHKYSNQDIVFVYFGVQCKKDKWKAAISEKKIIGEHFYLTNDQYSGLKEALKINIQGIPYYIIVDRNGKLVNPNAPGPFMEDELYKIFDKLIME